LIGYLSIKSTPKGASIFLNEKRSGWTPANIAGLAPKKYSVTLELVGYKTVTQTVTVYNGQTASINVNLKKNK
jgi:hypothetical protein